MRQGRTLGVFFDNTFRSFFDFGRENPHRFEIHNWSSKGNEAFVGRLACSFNTAKHLERDSSSQLSR